MTEAAPGPVAGTWRLHKGAQRGAVQTQFKGPCRRRQGLGDLILRVKRGDDYTATLNLTWKVLDFIQFGGPECTVGGTVLEMWLGRL